MKENEEQSVTINRRLRPIRFGFLVSPGDTKMLRRAIQINTCLWGGRFNPILPFFKSTHPSLIEGRYKPSPRSIVQGYIDGFAPDYLVVKDRKALKGIVFSQDRIIEIAEVLNPAGQQPFGFGLDVSHVYNDLYEKEFKFQRRHPAKVILPSSKDKELVLFYAAFFGEFPPEKELAYLTRQYEESFGAEKKDVRSQDFYKLLFERPLNPLRAGSVSLQSRNPDRNEPQIFFMDGSSKLDLMDYWNLRATGRFVVPMPMQLAEHSIESLSNFVRGNYVPDKYNKTWMHHTTIICSRTCKLSDVELFVKKLTIPPNSLMIQRWYPRIWDEWARVEAHEGIGTVTANEEETTVVSSGGRITFSTLAPDFVEHVYSERNPNWVNVISLSYQGKLSGAPVVPPGIADFDRIICDGSIHSKWVTDEGIIVPCMYWRDSQFWELPTSLSIFKTYMRQFGYEIDVSPAGKITTQVLRAVEGVWGISSFGNEEVLKKLEHMAHGIAESDDLDSFKRPRKTRAATVSQKTWWALIQRASDGNATLAENWMKNLLRNGVFHLGLRLQCPKCSQHTWFGLEQLGNRINCERCLQEFPFPMTPPSEESWHYRTVGPFSIEGYAHGSYCTLLTANFLFGHHFHGATTWLPSITFKSTKQQPREVEADFAAFWRPDSFGQHLSPILVLGECKTFDQFKAKDVKRMEMLANTFPGAVIVFSTLRKQLTDKEKRLITSLAKKGREHLKADRWRSPVMVLTGIELLNRMGPPSCWKDAGMPYSQYEREYWQHRKPQELCEMLQRMHLGMPSYHEWYEQQRAKKLKKAGQVQ